MYGSSGYKQPVAVEKDTRDKTVGFSAVTDKEELLSGELTLVQGKSERPKERTMSRRQRRKRSQNRPVRFDNQRKPEGQLAPSIQDKLDSQLWLAEKIKTVLPVTRVVVKAANMQALNNTPGITGIEYQQGG